LSGFLLCRAPESLRSRIEVQQRLICLGGKVGCILVFDTRILLIGKHLNSN
jgi:hypothetical protein